MNEVPKPDSTFRLVLLAAKRAEQLIEGAKPRLDDHNCFKPTTIALKEVEAGLVPWRILAAEEYERLREQELTQREQEKERDLVVAPASPPPVETFADSSDEEEDEELEEPETLPGDEDLAELEEFSGEELLDEEE